MAGPATERSAARAGSGPIERPREQANGRAAEPPLPAAVVATHFFDPGEAGGPYKATVRVSGSLIGSRTGATFPTSFVIDEVFQAIPGGGPIAITTRATDVQPGDWTVSAELIPRLTEDAADHGFGRASTRVLSPARWSWSRWRLLPTERGPVKSHWSMLSPLIPAPGMLPGAYPALVALATVIVVAGQAVYLERDAVLRTAWLPATLVAILAGLIAAKLWYAVLNPTHSWARGWAVDGFIVVAPLAAMLTLVASSLPVGTYLDGTMPGLFLGVAVGRVGCLFAGCCSGACSTSRWAIWSSDPRIGARRVPAQLLESATGVALAVVAAVLIASGRLPAGLTFALTYGAYAIVRQVLLRVRSEPRRSPRTIPATGIAIGLTVAAGLALGLLQANRG